MGYELRDAVNEVNTEELVSKMTLEEYNTCSEVYSAMVRDEQINKHGVRKGYFETNLKKSNSRGRKPTLKITGVKVTVNILYGPLAEIAKEMSGEIYEGYQKFLEVNSCSSKIRYTNERQRGWTDLLRSCFRDYNKVYKITEEDISWEEYDSQFREIYGVGPYEFGSWDDFYNLYSPWFKIVADEFFFRMLNVLRER